MAFLIDQPSAIVLARAMVYVYFLANHVYVTITQIYVYCQYIATRIYT